jgi:hypothetical protein
MADTIFQAIARLRFPRAGSITGSGPFALLRSPDVLLFESWVAMNAAKKPLENWQKLSEPKPEPKFNSGIARFRRMVESA